MEKDLEQQLATRFPSYFRDMNGDPVKTCMAWGCDHGNGWYRLLYQTCLKIEEALKDDPNKDNFHFNQVKEKFGTLRIYWSCGNKTVSNIIDDAEDQSGTICEVCGSTDEVETEGPGWLTTHCKDCKASGAKPEDARRRHLADLEVLKKAIEDGKRGK